MAILLRKARSAWIRFWLLFAKRGHIARFATRMACLVGAPFVIRWNLKQGRECPFVAPSADIEHSKLRLSPGAYIDERVLIRLGNPEGGPVHVASGVAILRDSIIQTGSGASVSIGEGTWIQPRCYLVAYLNDIRIGKGVQIAPNCSFFPYDHGIAPGVLIADQGITSKGPIIVDDDAWLGCGVVVLSGVRIGKGAVIGAHAVVTRSVPDGAIAVGNPARIVKSRAELKAVPQ